MTSAFTLAAIEFTSPAMLGWLAAAALPWLINLWTRRRHVETPWAAIDLLLTAIRERSRRLRLSEILLLALRTAILILVAAAAAQPVWRQSAVAGDAKHRIHHILVIDQSFSMATRAAESSRFERAQARSRQIVADAAAGDAFTVIAWSEVADNILSRPTFESAAALAAVDAIVPLDTVANLPAAVRAVDAAITSTNKEFPSLIRTRTAFISDLSQNTWSAALMPRDEAAPAEPPRNAKTPIDTSSTNSPWKNLAARTEIVLENVNEGARENLAITSLTLDPPQPVLDRPVTIAVGLKSFGREPTSSVNVELFLDGTPLAQQAASLQPGGEATLHFETRLIDPGNHVFEARLPDDVDVLAVDNRRWLSTDATRGPRVICVADIPAAAEDVARALNPRYREAGAEDAIAVEIIATPALAATDLSTYDAAFLCNVAELSEREQRLLNQYIATGGAAVIILGDRVRPTAYNEFFNGRARLLPLQIADQPVTGDWRLDPLSYQHPVAAPFAGRTRSGLLGVRISQYYPLRIERPREDQAPAVALALTSGDPALVVGDYGHGRIAVLATDPALTTDGEPWSTFAVSPSFVPLLRELFSCLTADARTEQLNRIAGDPLPPPFEANMQAKRGIYRTPGADPLQRSAAIAVNVDPAESDLAAVDAADLQSPGVAAATASAGDGASYAGSIPLAGYLLAAAAVLVLIELTVAWLFGRGWG